ncbi:radical SAM family heme chaperone HemW [Litoribacillus peritrichatus]|uniref:radical SAM family heme chaperone HemW n=1 Tax=Litoribacillus peritrichatus TaxID=718191 RepID=UPI0031D1D19F
MNLPPLSLYIHTPWCIRKCPYCDFNSHQTTKEAIPEQAYLEQLIKDLKADKAWAQNRPIESVFIGGGTPSLLSGRFYQTLFEQLNQHLSFRTDAEITMEANPGAIEASRFSEYRSAGINRLSLGVQSFQDDKLTALGRIHSATNAITAVDVLRSAGFDNFNIDLMHGLPNQTIEDACFDLETAIKLKPSHLSWYQLTIEPNTEFFSKPPPLPEEDALCDIIDEGQRLIANAGFQQYEVSAYAQPGKQSRHNTNYWQFGDYLALGAGAHGKITLANGELFRYRKVRQPNHYLDTRRLSLTASVDPIHQEDIPLEFLMNTLRLTQGFEESLLESTTGLPLSTISAPLDRAIKEGLLEKVDTKIRPTLKGRMYLNELLERFLS